MNSLDVFQTVKKLKGLEGGRAGKIYFDKYYYVEFYSRALGKGFLVLGKDLLTFSDSKSGSADNFSQQLRKLIENKRLREVKQIGWERIVSLKFDETELVVEIFSGNVIIVQNERIVRALEEREFRDRKVKRGLEYQLPPQLANPVELTEINSPVAPFLATKCGLGGTLAENVCALANVEPMGVPTAEEVKRIVNVVKGLKETEGQFLPVPVTLNVRKADNRTKTAEKFEAEALQMQEKGDLLMTNHVAVDSVIKSLKKGEVVKGVTFDRHKGRAVVEF